MGSEFRLASSECAIRAPFLLPATFLPALLALAPAGRWCFCFFFSRTCCDEVPADVLRAEQLLEQARAAVQSRGQQYYEFDSMTCKGRGGDADRTLSRKQGVGVLSKSMKSPGL